MNSLRTIHPSHTLTRSHPHVLPISDEHCLLLSANQISFVRLHKVPRTTELGDAPEFSASDAVDCLAVAPHSKHFACGISGLNPRIDVFRYPEMDLVAELTGPLDVQYEAMSLSQHATYIAALTSAPENSLSVWDLASSQELATFTNVSSVVDLQFSPAVDTMLCVANASSLTSHCIETKSDRVCVKSKEIDLLPMLGAEGEEFVAFARWAGRAELYCSTTSETGKLFRIMIEVDAEECLVENIEPAVSPLHLDFVGSIMSLDVCLPFVVLACKTGDLHFVSRSTLAVVFSQSVSEVSLVSVVFLAPSYTRMVCLDSHGRVLVAPVEKLGLMDHVEMDEFTLGLELVTTVPCSQSEESDVATVYKVLSFPASLHAVVSGSDASLRVYDLQTGTIVGNSSVCLDSPLSCVTFVPNYHGGEILFGGFQDGTICLFDAREKHNLRVVYSTRLLDSAVVHARASPDGSLVAIAGESCLALFRVRDRAFLLFNDFEESVAWIEWAELVDGSTPLTFFTFETEDASIVTLRDVDDFMASKCPNSTSFRISFLEVQAQCVETPGDIPSLACCVSPLDRSALLSVGCDGGLRVWSVRDNGLVKLVRVADGHDAAGTTINLAVNSLVGSGQAGTKSLGSNALLIAATGGEDGKVLLWNATTLEPAIELLEHSWRHEINSLSITHDSRQVVSAAADGSVFVWPIADGDAPSVAEADQAAAVARERVSSARRASTPSISKVVLNDLMTVPKASSFETPLTASLPSLSANAQQRSESDMMEVQSDSLVISGGESQSKLTSKSTSDLDPKYQAEISKLRSDLSSIRSDFENVVARNNNLLEDERLPHSDLIVDVEEEQAMTAETDAQVGEVRQELHYGNLKSVLVKERIKEECWDKMDTAEIVLSNFENTFEVRSFPIKKAEREDSAVLKRMMFARKMSDLALRETDDSPASFSPMVVEKDNEFARRFQVQNPALQAPEMCVTNNRARVQAMMLAHSVERLKTSFNKEFQAVFESKQADIATINEMSAEARAIQKELKAIDDSLPEFTLTEGEQPEKVFVIDDKDISAERVYTEEEQTAVEEAEAVRSQRELEAAKNDAPKRALHDMMNSTLEGKTEASIFEKTFEPEPWMDMEESELTNDQKEKIAQFNAAVEQHEKACDVRRKLLETQLKKLHADMLEACRNFDRRLEKLQSTKLHVLKEVYIRELNAVRLVVGIMFNELADEREEILWRQRDLKVEEINAKREVIGQLVESLANCRKAHDVAAVEDHHLEKNFKRSFTDVDESVDDLFKLFKLRKPVKKPKPIQETSQRNLLRQASTRKVSEMVTPTTTCTSSNTTRSQNTDDSVGSPMNPFLSGISRARVNEPELPEVKPNEDISPRVWERFLTLRKQKYLKEQEVHNLVKSVADAETELQKERKLESDLEEEIRSILKEQSTIKEKKARDALDAEIVLKLKQGQIEVAEAPVVTDLQKCVLVTRELVTELNKLISEAGAQKVAVLNEMKTFRRGINLLEWKTQKVSLTCQNYVDMATEFQLFRVTKDLPSLIKDGGHGSRQASEVATLKKSLRFLHQSIADKLTEKRQHLKRMRRRLRETDRENDALCGTVDNLTATVRDREKIHDIRVHSQSDGSANKENSRMENVVTRRKLVDLVKAQGDEIDFLQKELDRHRKATFPSFT